MTTQKKHKIWAVIPAAGVGRRLQNTTPNNKEPHNKELMAKQYMLLGSKTVLQRAIQPFIDSTQIEKVVVCVAQKDQQWQVLKQQLKHQFKIDKLMQAQGGETRADSVLNGLHTLHPYATNDDWVIVHDAARPLLTNEMLSHLINEVYDTQHGGIFALPSVDTIKKAKQSSSESDCIETTIEREYIWQAQTPQMFRYDDLLNALKQTLAQGVAITDESSAIEWIGKSPKIIQGQRSNLKITEYADLSLADYYLTKKSD